MKSLAKNLFIIYMLVNFKSFAAINSSRNNLDPADLKFEQCKAKSQNTDLEMTKCAYEGYENWDKALNEVYQQLLSKNELTNKKELIDAQKAWLKFRDAEFEGISAICSHLPGNTEAYCWISKAAVIKIRTLQLRSHLEYINLLRNTTVN